MKIATALAALLLIASCRSKPPPVPPKEPNPMNPSAFINGEEDGETEGAAHIPALAIEMPVYELPSEGEAAARRTEADGLSIVALRGATLEIQPRNEYYRGGAVVYPFVPNHVYQVFTALEKLTCIQLEPGEELVSPPASGNTDVFDVQFAYSRENGLARAQIYIMPYLPNRSTTLFVNTSKRTYSFMVYSYPTVFMPLVSFTYPQQTIDAIRQQLESASTDIPVFGSITSLDFGYDIIPHSPYQPRWMPSLVFNDGVKTYIYFPSAARASYAPVLFEVNSRNDRVIVNYRVQGTYYIVDRVLTRAELVLDVNEGNIITIRRR